MNRDNFVETLRRHYSEEVYEAFMECRHHLNQDLDLEQLSHRLIKLMRNAKKEGLSEQDYDDIVRTTLPEFKEKSPYFYKEHKKKKAA